MNFKLPTNTFSPFLQLVMVILLSFGFLTAIGGSLAWLCILIYSGDSTFFTRLMNANIEFKTLNSTPLLIIQATMAATGFIIFPLLWNKFIWKQKMSQLFGQEQGHHIKYIPLLMGSLISLMILLLPITEWNKNIVFPESWASLENTFKHLEAQAEAQLAIFTNITSVNQLIISLIVLALIPSIGEELLFRGLFQPIFITLTKNYHIGIMLTALFFSFFHFQFYGFFPRFLFGVFFGYITYFTASLYPSIICHFINNALMVVLLYLNKTEVLSTDYSNHKGLSFTYNLAALIFFFIFVTLYLSLLKKNGRVENRV